jgi:hypothetical protein
MARTRTTKAVAQRIDLNYFKRPTPFKRAKLWLAILAPAIALVWIGWHVLGRDNRVYSSGRLSEAHAVLEKECAACHVQQVGGYSAAAADSACLACHDGPVHHATNLSVKLACAECHVEHRGRVNLVATKNESCAQCHGDLSRAGRDSKYFKHIRTFADRHPEFAALRSVRGTSASDSGTIKLNHALHMRSIRRGPSGPMVQLDCSDCHRTAASQSIDWPYGDAKYAAAATAYKDKDEFREVNSRGLTARTPASGRELIAPPNFANACAGCHLLTFDTRFEEGVPHDIPQVIHEYLVRRFAKYIATHPSELHEAQNPLRNLAGRENRPAMRTVSGAQWVAERVAVSEELLWHKTCAQCHAVSASTLQDVRIARWDTGKSSHQTSPSVSLAGLELGATERSLPEIANANITLQWLPNARFDHDAHRGFSCTGCHQNALTSTETSDILIPGIATCQKCHAGGSDRAESRCFECHTYHDWAKRKDVKPTFTLPALRSTGK